MKIPTLTAIFGTPIAFIFGTWTELMTALALMIALDILSGFIKGIVHKELRSRKMSIGMLRKASIWIVIIVSNIVDVAMSQTFQGLPVAKTATVLFYIGMEGLSILENLSAIGVPIPSWIGKYLSAIKEKGESPEEPRVQKVQEIVVKKQDGEEVKLKTEKKD
ncbi:phage holin family protein [Priestia sp. SB1]|uniref:phage holin family protein n=1 Tax=Priestia sp. SB1 TaxID=3132359 RepID=UPI00317CAA76